MTNPLKNVIKDDTEILQYVDEHPTQHNIINGIQLITDIGINSITKISN